jgi:hypothetical protein
MYETPCEKLAYLEGMRVCGNCEDVGRNERLRGRERHRNQRYLAACLADCIRRGETPYASHGLLTLPGVLDDTKPEERAKGIAAGFAMREAMHASVFYGDLGWSNGMRAGKEHAEKLQRDQEDYAESHDDRYPRTHVIEIRELGKDWDRK